MLGSLPSSRAVLSIQPHQVDSQPSLPSLPQETWPTGQAVLLPLEAQKCSEVRCPHILRCPQGEDILQQDKPVPLHLWVKICKGRCKTTQKEL